MDDRQTKLLVGLNKVDPIIEIGPLHSGLAPKRDGWNVTNVDFAPRVDLVAKYTNSPLVDTNAIEDVDFIWRGDLLEALPADRRGSYRALIASHVIEHVPDLIDFLNCARHLLHSELGVVVLAVPDKRWCFDIFRPLSTCGQILEAHSRRDTVHSMSRIFDHEAYTVAVGGLPAWGRHPLIGLSFFGHLEHAHAAFLRAGSPGRGYEDYHAWQFTPASFELMILELGALGVIDWQISWLEPQAGAEFLCQLRPGTESFPSPEAREAKRLTLLRRVIQELAEVAKYVTDEPADSQTLDPGFATRMPQVTDPGLHKRVDLLEGQLASLAEEVRPVRQLLNRLLPLRRVVARMRGRA